MTKSTHGHLLRDEEHQSKFPEKQFNMIFKTQILNLEKQTHFWHLFIIIFKNIGLKGIQEAHRLPRGHMLVNAPRICRVKGSWPFSRKCPNCIKRLVGMTLKHLFV